MSVFYQDRQEHFRLFLSENNRFPSHLHRQAEGIFVLSGSLRVTVGEESREMKKGQYFFIFPHQIHSLYTGRRSRILLFIFAPGLCPAFARAFSSFRPVFCPLSADELSEEGRAALYTLKKLWLPAPADGFAAPGAPASRGADALDSPLPGPNVSCRLLLTESYMQILLADTFRRLALTPHSETGGLELSRRVLAYIGSHYAEELTLDTLAVRFHTSRFTVSRIFSEKLRVSFPAYLNGWRLEHARKLLLSTSLTVTEAAYESGFKSTRTFFRSFRETYGCTPGQYRQRRGERL